MTPDALREHIDTFFGDQSRSPVQTKEALLDLADRMLMLADSIEVEDGLDL